MYWIYRIKDQRDRFLDSFMNFKEDMYLIFFLKNSSKDNCHVFDINNMAILRVRFWIKRVRALMQGL